MEGSSGDWLRADSTLESVLYAWYSYDPSLCTRSHHRWLCCCTSGTTGLGSIPVPLCHLVCSLGNADMKSVPMFNYVPWLPGTAVRKDIFCTQVSPRDSAAVRLVQLQRVHGPRSLVHSDELHRPLSHVHLLRIQGSQVMHLLNNFIIFHFRKKRANCSLKSAQLTFTDCNCIFI